MYPYDTNIISELRKKNANQNVVDFVSHIATQNTAFISVITLGEIIKGIEKLRQRNDHPQANALQTWLQQDLNHYFADILTFDKQCAKVWGQLMASNPQHIEDNQIVATAIVHDLILVTRNTKDIEQTSVKFINPFVHH